MVTFSYIGRGFLFFAISEYEAEGVSFVFAKIMKSFKKNAPIANFYPKVFAVT
jgi:hypothetical protein